MLSLSMLGEQGEPLLTHPRTGKPVQEAKIKPQNLEKASPYALDVNNYPAWRRFMDADEDGERRGDKYEGWKKDKKKREALQEAWKEFHLNPSEDEAKAREGDEWSDAIPFEEWRDQVAEVLKNRRVVGQNPFFDQRFLEFELDRAGSDQKIGDDIIDTQVLSWLAGMQHQSLGNTTEQLGIKLEDAHTAYADTEATRQVFEKLKDPKVLGDIRRSQDPEKARTRDVLFLGMTTSGDNPKKDEITGMAIVDARGKTLLDAKLDSDEDRQKAIQAVTRLTENMALGTTDPDRDLGFLSQMAKKHGRRMPDGRRVIDGWQGGRRFFHSPSLTQIYGVEPQGKDGTPLEKAKQQVGMFHEVAEQAYGSEGEHRKDFEKFEEWAGGRTYRHPLPKGHPARRKDYLTFSGLTQLTKAEDPGVAQKGKQTVMRLWRQFQQAQQQKQAARVASSWLRGFLRRSSGK
jgi:DNA polymerase III epsilon subunit-like protein